MNTKQSNHPLFSVFNLEFWGKPLLSTVCFEVLSSSAKLNPNFGVLQRLYYTFLVNTLLCLLFFITVYLLIYHHFAIIKLNT